MEGNMIRKERRKKIGRNEERLTGDHKSQDQEVTGQ